MTMPTHLEVDGEVHDLAVRELVRKFTEVIEVPLSAATDADHEGHFGGDARRLPYQPRELNRVLPWQVRVRIGNVPLLGNVAPRREVEVFRLEVNGMFHTRITEGLMGRVRDSCARDHGAFIDADGAHVDRGHHFAPIVSDREDVAQLRRDVQRLT